MSPLLIAVLIFLACAATLALAVAVVVARSLRGIATSLATSAHAHTKLMETIIVIQMQHSELTEDIGELMQYIYGVEPWGLLLPRQRERQARAAGNGT